MSGAAPTLLEYASLAATRQPWGPWFFRPSRRSLILMLLIGVAVTWLAARHDPWRLVATIPANYYLTPLFTPDNEILAFHTQLGVHLYDPASGQLLRTVLPSINTGDYRYFVLKNGEQILALPWTDRVALLYDVSSGRLIDKLPNPDGLGSQLVRIAPDAPRIVTLRSGLPKYSGATSSGDAGGARLLLWDLAAKPPSTQPILLPRHGSGTTFSPDGRRILQSIDAQLGFILLDAHANLVGWMDYPQPRGIIAARFVTANHFWVSRPDPTGKVDLLEIRSSETGELIREVTGLPSGICASALSALSDDAALIVTLNSNIPGTLGGAGKLEIRQTATGRVVVTTSCRCICPPVFFPQSHRLVAIDGDTPRLAVIDPAHSQPIALLPGEYHSPPLAVISPDGQTIVAATGQRDGLDCPESYLGALAFPQTWLTCAFFIALNFSLLHDARRVRPASVVRPPSRLVSLLLIAITLPLTIHALLAACLGRLTLTPAPLLLLAAIGLATHSRAWRLITLLLLAINLPLCLYVLRRIHQTGLSSSTRYPLLDRFHEIPNILPFTALAAATLLIIIALPVLARRR
jgi:hypothetical protein